MKQLLCIFTLVLTIGLLPGIGFAEQKYQFKQPSALDGPYNPSTRYAGRYKIELVFFRYESDAWQRKPKLDRLRYIKCQDALKHLGQSGTWLGTLNVDGSCGAMGMPGEHPEWATGNWLNYNEQLTMQGQ